MDLDRDSLMQMIDARFQANITDWYRTYLMPLHDAQNAKLDEVMATLNKARGAWIVLGVLGAGCIVLINHFWK